MLSIRRTIWIYENFGAVCACKALVYDIEALLLYIIYYDAPISVYFDTV